MELTFSYILPGQTSIDKKVKYNPKCRTFIVIHLMHSAIVHLYIMARVIFTPKTVWQTLHTRIVVYVSYTLGTRSTLRLQASVWHTVTTRHYLNWELFIDHYTRSRQLLIGWQYSSDQSDRQLLIEWPYSSDQSDRQLFIGWLYSSDQSDRQLLIRSLYSSDQSDRQLLIASP